MPPKKLNLNQCIIENSIAGVACLMNSNKNDIIYLHDVHMNNLIRFGRTKILKLILSYKQVKFSYIDEKYFVEKLISTEEYDLLIVMLENKLFTFAERMITQEYRKMIYNYAYEKTNNHVGVNKVETILATKNIDLIKTLIENYKIVVTETAARKFIDFVWYKSQCSCEIAMNVLKKINVVYKHNTDLVYSLCQIPPYEERIVNLTDIPHMSFVHFVHTNSLHSIYKYTKCSLELLLPLNRLLKQHKTLMDLHVIGYIIRDFLYYPNKGK